MYALSIEDCKIEQEDYNPRSPDLEYKARNSPKEDKFETTDFYTKDDSISKEWSFIVFSGNTYSLEMDFRRLVKIWQAETRRSSVIAKRYQHHAYKAILKKGPVVIPLILRELRRDPDRWFAALESLSKENPAKDCGTFYEAVDRWISWGIAKGYVE